MLAPSEVMVEVVGAYRFVWDGAKDLQTRKMIVERAEADWALLNDFLYTLNVSLAAEVDNDSATNPPAVYSFGNTFRKYVQDMWTEFSRWLGM